jgi:hypothetical protein
MNCGNLIGDMMNSKRAKLFDPSFIYCNSYEASKPGYLKDRFATVYGLQQPPPYQEFCRHPDKCAGLSSCPLDPTCAD